MFDLKNLIPDDSPVVVHLKHPNTGEDLGMTIKVASRHSDAYENYMYARAQARIDQEDTSELTLKDMRDESIKMFSALTIEWTLVFDGKTPRVTPKKAEEIYRKAKWVVDQIDVAMSEREAFTHA